MHLTPKPITQEDIVQGRYNTREFAPGLWQIPGKFRDPSSPLVQAASMLMWQGSGALIRAEARGGIDRDKALLHVGAVLHAMDIPVEQREAAAAFLLDEWFVRLELVGGLTVAPGRG